MALSALSPLRLFFFARSSFCLSTRLLMCHGVCHSSLESPEAFATALWQLEVKSKGCNGSESQTPPTLKLTGNDASMWSWTNCHRAVRRVVKSSRLSVGSRLQVSNVFPMRRCMSLFHFSHPPWTLLAIGKVVPPTINVAGNVNSTFSMSALEDFIEPSICGMLLVVPDGPISAIMAAFRHWRRYPKSQVEPLGQSTKLSPSIVASSSSYILDQRFIFPCRRSVSPKTSKNSKDFCVCFCIHGL